MLQLTKPIAFIDIEATGTNVCTDRIVEIAIVKYLTDGNRTVKRKLLNPGMPIPQAVCDIHGITDEMVKNAPPFKQAAQEIKQFLDGCDLHASHADLLRRWSSASSSTQVDVLTTGGRFGGGAIRLRTIAGEETLSKNLVPPYSATLIIGVAVMLEPESTTSAAGEDEILQLLDSAAVVHLTLTWSSLDQLLRVYRGTQAGTFAGSGLPPSTLSTRNFVAPGGNRPRIVETVSVASESIRAGRCPRKRPKKFRTNAQADRSRR